MRDLRIYKALPEWTSATLPAGFQRKHNTREGTWAQLTVRAGALRFTHLDAEGEETSSQVIDAAAGPQLVEPEAFHKVEPVDEALRCQLSFLCEPERYLEKKYGLTAPHSEVRALLPELERAQGRTVLDLGSGRGRNSFFLAERGFTVTAVDRSEASIATLLEIQSAEELPVSAHVYDIHEARLAELLDGGMVDHVVSTVVFQFLDAARQPAILRDLQAVTRGGGLNLIVTPVTSEERPCPIPFAGVLARGELREHYRDWEIQRYEETVGEFHRRDEQGNRYEAEFATLVARKPSRG